jgi:hypothetical protein
MIYFNDYAAWVKTVTDNMTHNMDTVFADTYEGIREGHDGDGTLLAYWDKLDCVGYVCDELVAS